MKTRHPKAVQREAAARARARFTHIRHWATDDTELEVTCLSSAIAQALEQGDSVRENVPEDFNCSSWVMLVSHGHVTAMGRRRLREALCDRLGLTEDQVGFVAAALSAKDDEVAREQWA